MTNPLAKLSAATTALAEARSLDEVKRIIDITEAARTYAKAAKLGLEAQNHAAELKLRAERKAGELLAQLERGKTGPKLPDTLSDNSVYRQVIEENQIEERQAQRWQAVATVPDELFEEHLAEVKAEQREVTSAGLLRVASELRREAMAMARQETPPLPANKYRIIYADPPWRYSDSGVITETDAYGRAARHYPTMSLDDLCALGSQVRRLADDNAVLFLWTTSPMLEDSFEVIRSWGFEYKTSFVWDKVRHNFGHYNSVRHELLLICTRGSCTPDTKTLYDSVLSVERTDKHSEKPEEFRQIIDSLYTWGKRIELFARCAAENWEKWGNEPDAIRNSE